MKITYVARCLHPGFLFPENSTVNLGESCPTIYETANKIPKGAYCFTLVKVITLEAIREDGKIINNDHYETVSKTIYPDGEVLTLEQIGKQFGENSILFNNMKFNNWPTVVKTRHGNYQPFTDKDEIIGKHVKTEKSEKSNRRILEI